MAVVRWSNGLSGALLALAALVFLSFLPDNVADYAREPEDVWLSGFWIALLGLVAALCFMNATSPTTMPWWRFLANWAVVVVMTVLIVLAALIYWDVLSVLLLAVCGLGPVTAQIGARRISRVQQS